jgi:hypothetical protein
MKAGEHIPVNFEEQEDPLLVRQIPITVKNTPAPGKPSTKLDGLNLEIKMPPAVWLTVRRRASALHYGEPAIHVCFVSN